MGRRANTAGAGRSITVELSAAQSLFPHHGIIWAAAIFFGHLLFWRQRQNSRFLVRCSSNRHRWAVVILAGVNLGGRTSRLASTKRHRWRTSETISASLNA